MSTNASFLVIAENGGIVGRGVLLDYAEWAERHSIKLEPFQSQPILLQHLQQIVEEQNIQLRPGDILFIRSGFTAAYESLSMEDQKALPLREQPNFIGVEAGEATLRWLWRHQFAAIASDSPSFERAPIAGPHANLDEMLHQWLDISSRSLLFILLLTRSRCLAGWGMPIGELFDLEKLAQHCKETNRYTFFLSSVPLKVSCPVRNKCELETHSDRYQEALRARQMPLQSFSAVSMRVFSA